MPCDTAIQNLPALERGAAEERQKAALARLDAALQGGTVKVVIGASGSVAFRGLWRSDGVTDLCAFRRLQASNSPALRKALNRAEVIAGRTVDAKAISAGVHSHDGGRTWGSH